MVFSFEPLSRGHRCGPTALSLIAGFLLLQGGAARADEPRKVNEPSVMREPGELVQVADAFDDDDPFDLNLSLGYESVWTSSRIYRENSLTQTGLTTGGYTTANMNVAKYDQHVSRLNTKAEIGIYHDIALIVRMPIILS